MNRTLFRLPRTLVAAAVLGGLGACLAGCTNDNPPPQNTTVVTPPAPRNTTVVTPPSSTPGPPGPAGASGAPGAAGAPGPSGAAGAPGASAPASGTTGGSSTP